MPRLALSHVLCHPHGSSISSRVHSVDQLGYVLGRLTSASILHLQGDSRKDISDMHKTIRQSIRKTFKMNHVIRKVCVVCVCVCASVCVMTFATFFARFASSSQLCPTAFYYTHLRLQKRHQRSIRKCLRSSSDTPNIPLCGLRFLCLLRTFLFVLSPLVYGWLPLEVCTF